MKRTLLLFTSLLFLFPLSAQNKKNLQINLSDFYLLQDQKQGGYHLYIRKKAGFESVMLVESNKDPAGKKTNYAFRALEYNPVNGDEVRLLNGKVLDSKYAKFSLIDSTAEYNEVFGSAFHIYIPTKLIFGYPWARNGELEVKDSLYVNFRTFGKKYADYSGGFADNAFTLNLKHSGGLPAVVEETENTGENPSEIRIEAEAFNADDTFTNYDEQPAKGTENSSSYQPVDDDSSGFEYTTYKVEENPDDTDSGETFGEYKDTDYFMGFDYEHSDDPAYQPKKNYTENNLDSPSLTPFEEDDNNYALKGPYANKASDKDDGDSLSVPEQPFEESMKGVDVEAMEALINSEPRAKVVRRNPSGETKSASPAKINPFDPNRYIGYDGIELIYVEGTKKYPDLYISETEVTQYSYKRIMGTNPSENQGEKLPVENISFYDAIVFCNKLSLREGRTACYSLKGETNPKKWGNVPVSRSANWATITCNFDADGYRLLTIDEWVFFANGGVNKSNGNYAGSKDLDSVAWYAENSGEVMSPGGIKDKNACGLYDMCGNLSEYVWGNSGDKEKTTALKGGNFLSDEKACQTKNTQATNPWLAEPVNGLRICRRVE